MYYRLVMHGNSNIKFILKSLFRFLRNKSFYVLIQFRQNLFNQVEIIKLPVLERIVSVVAKFNTTDTFI